jgi:hypothetical protein
LQHGGAYGYALHDLVVIIDSFGSGWKTKFELKELLCLTAWGYE